jgi:hypothetical protein
VHVRRDDDEEGMNTLRSVLLLSLLIDFALRPARER